MANNPKITGGDKKKAFETAKAKTRKGDEGKSSTTIFFVMMIFYSI